APHHPLCAGGLQLPVDGEQFARRGKDQVGIVQRGVDGVPLGHADTHVGPSLPGGPAQDLCLRPRHQDGVVVVQPPVLPARGGPAAHGEAESHAVGI
ncbi:NifU family protein, partial [Dysosmobacter welbionis]